MIDKDFLKDLSILYVEDDEEVRSSLEFTMEKIFKRIFLASNGEEAIEIFLKLREKGHKIDVIISDINMPRMNGIDLLKNIREHDTEMPFIFTTAYSETEYMLEAIHLDATDYLLKPLQLKQLFSKLTRACRDRHQKDLIQKQKAELSRYLRAIDYVAVISKTDLTGKITFANQNFCDISGYTKEELYGKPHSIVRHPDVSSEIFKQMWETIQKGEIWQGKLKNLAKDGSSYYVNSTIIPVYNDFSEIREYIAIRFVTTEEEVEKREFKKKVIQNIQVAKKKQMEDANQIKQLETQLKGGGNIYALQEALHKERTKVARMRQQMQHLEDEIKVFHQRRDDLVDRGNEKVNLANKQAQSFKAVNDKLSEERLQLKIALDKKEEEAENLASQVSQKNRTIKDLRDVIEHREEQLAKLGVTIFRT